LFQQRGVTAGEARDLSKATAEGVIERAKPPEGAADVRELATCARSLEGALSARAEKRDEIGAVAAMVEIEANILDPATMASHANFGRGDLSPAQVAWRAVGARALVTKGAGGGRRVLMRDPDEDVRLAALKATLDVGETADAEAVLEAARLDPNPGARKLALRAAGAIGGERVVLGLHDIYAAAPVEERRAIADAWGSRRSIDVGGRRELAAILGGDAGGPGIEAALVLVRSSDARSPDAGAAQARLERAVREGASEDRALAIGAISLESDSVRAAILAASKESDDAVALAALGRRLDALGAKGDPKERAEIVARLVKLAEGSSAHAIEARGILARARAPEARAILLRDRSSPEAKLREAAGVGLAVMGDLSAAATLLADRDARVRSRVACAILRAR
jgi:hypothetical protein